MHGIFSKSTRRNGPCFSHVPYSTEFIPSGGYRSLRRLSENGVYLRRRRRLTVLRRWDGTDLRTVLAC